MSESTNLKRGRRKLLMLIAATVLLVSTVWLALFAAGAVSGPGKDAELFNMSDRIADLEVIETVDGLRYRFEGESLDILLTPEQVAAEIQRRRPAGRRGTLYSALNITNYTGLIWVGLGLLGQVLFTGRMVVQWIASEREQRSVIPNAFWWMSLGGATMLIIYFIWRVDIVGILGQSTGWFIYVRNLWFIYGKPDPPDS